jgi:DNA-directed RNA polymerase subunit RPC12/RpoP
VQLRPRLPDVVLRPAHERDPRLLERLVDGLAMRRDYYECENCGTQLGWVRQIFEPRPSMPCPYCAFVAWRHLPERRLIRGTTGVSSAVDLVH